MRPVPFRPSTPISRSSSSRSIDCAWMEPSTDDISAGSISARVRSTPPAIAISRSWTSTLPLSRSWNSICIGHGPSSPEAMVPRRRWRGGIASGTSSMKFTVPVRSESRTSFVTMSSLSSSTAISPERRSRSQSMWPLAETVPLAEANQPAVTGKMSSSASLLPPNSRRGTAKSRRPASLFRLCFSLPSIVNGP